MSKPSLHSPLKIDLTTFFLSVASAALMSMGIREDGSTDSSQVNLPLAQQNIDLLELMQEKTKGNRTSEEDQLLSQLLYESRMRFVQLKQKG